MAMKRATKKIAVMALILRLRAFLPTVAGWTGVVEFLPAKVAGGD